MQFKVSMFPFHSLLQGWEIFPLRLLRSWPWWGLCLTLLILFSVRLVMDSYSTYSSLILTSPWETCGGFLLLADLWWTPLTLLMAETCGDTYSSLLYSYSLWQTYELMLETCGEHLLHWWQVYKCSPETPAVGAVRWKGNLTEHLSSVPTEFCYHHHNHHHCHCHHRNNNQ